MAKRGTNLLDDIQLRRWIAAGGRIARSDGDGLTFTLSAAGTATWVLRYRIGGPQKEVTIGNYPDVTLAEARKTARKLRAAIDSGDDPAVEKRQEKARVTKIATVRQLVEDFKGKKLGGLAVDTVRYRIWDLDKIILPKLGSLPVDQVQPADVVHMIETANRTWTISKRILTSTKMLFAHACGLRLINVNPVVGIDLVALRGPRPPVRRRVMLTEPELRTLLADIEDIGTENALALRILLATCVRSTELATARWEYVDLDAGRWIVPEQNVKVRRAFMVPLTPTVVGWFRQLQELAGTSDWVLPARQERRRRNQGGDTHVGKTTLWAAIQRAFERGDIDIRRFTPHDTRSTAKGHMRNLGVSSDVSELALNHKLKGMEGIYDVREDIPERRVALELWAAFLDSCASGTAWNVTPLRAAS
ncbi:MAG: tyrosine-type recombinase/integrase [Achromobacter sp.]|uniref:tyrosine-type recombinase/integrase n=1 Tax=unclassified Achromobacter TaxID=2626865 RepID=UPI0006C7319B|nr:MULTISPECIES: site-specific integrase [unclassified Achromobacter]MBN9642029.1 tyrosine-type recombinase/integrase [Achromobacter sp.]CUJ66909.1 Prophage CP4-57 integrase [Achromobacter sp. 2789STDY5608628]